MTPTPSTDQFMAKHSTGEVALIITNWNGQHHLETCLSSIFAQTFKDFVVVVVDNGSTDGSVEWLRAHYPQVQTLQNETNLGLCFANNRGILATDAEFVAILNNDTEYEPEWLDNLMRVMKSDPQIGMCAPKMLLAARHDMIESAGIVVDRAGIAWGLESGARDYPGATPLPVFGACGGAALYRRSMLLEVGLFDEDFFIYLEDADLAWRAQWADWQCIYVPEAVMYHAHSATTKEGSPFKTRLLGRNKIWLICKNYPWPYLFWYSPLIIGYELLAIGYNMAMGRGGNALKGRLEGLRQLPRMMAKRRQIVRKISSKTMMIDRLHPAINPFSLWRGTANISKASAKNKQ
jgi:GT2 family glycosyltransferase